MVAYQKKQLSQLSFVTPDNIISSKKQYINKIQYIQKICAYNTTCKTTESRSFFL